MKKRGINVSVFGIGWPNGQVSSDEMNDIFMNSRINLNISNSENHDLRYAFHVPFGFSDLISDNLKINLKKIISKAREIKKIVTKIEDQQRIDNPLQFLLMPRQILEWTTQLVRLR